MPEASPFPKGALLPKGLNTSPEFLAQHKGPLPLAISLDFLVVGKE
jgi:hypothetical protein